MHTLAINLAGPFFNQLYMGSKYIMEELKQRPLLLFEKGSRFSQDKLSSARINQLLIDEVKGQFLK